MLGNTHHRKVQSAAQDLGFSFLRDPNNSRVNKQTRQKHNMRRGSGSSITDWQKPVSHTIHAQRCLFLQQKSQRTTTDQLENLPSDGFCSLKDDSSCLSLREIHPTPEYASLRRRSHVAPMVVKAGLTSLCDPTRQKQDQCTSECHRGQG